MLKKLFGKKTKPDDYTKEEWDRHLLFKSIENDTFMCKLFNVVNDKEEFKKQFDEKATSLKPGESFNVCLGGKIRKIQKDDSYKLSIINQ